MSKNRLEAFSDGFIAIILWFVPDRRIERAMRLHEKQEIED